MLFNHYAYHANGSTIHSKIQLMNNGNLVDDCPIKLGGTQMSSYLKLRRPTDDELATLEPVHMTKDKV